MSRLPGQRLHSLSEMQMMGQSAQQKAITRVAVLEQTMGALQRKQGEIEASVLQVIDAFNQQQTAIEMLQDEAVAQHEFMKQAIKSLTDINRDLLARVTDMEADAARNAPPKRKPGRPKSSKNKPKAAATAETVSAAPETAPGEAAE